MADFDQKAKVMKPQPVASQAVETTAPKFERGEARLRVMTPEQHSTRFEQAKAVVLQRHPAMTRIAGRTDSGIIEKMIRAQVVRELDSERMELMPLQPGFMDKYPWLSPPAQNLPL
jgi:hypothetical protein